MSPVRSSSGQMRASRELMHQRRAGVRVPALRMVDAPAGVLAIEWIEGRSVRALLGGGAPEEEDTLSDSELDSAPVEQEEDPLATFGTTQGPSVFTNPRQMS